MLGWTEDDPRGVLRVGFRRAVEGSDVVIHHRWPWFSIVALAIAAGAAGPELPPLNSKVAAFAREHLGRPVGDGVCITLAVEALGASGAKQPPLDDPQGDYTWGTRVDAMADALPGDILQFKDAVFQGKRTVGRNRREYWRLDYRRHTAIVARVAERGKVVTVYHQNVATEGRDPEEKGNVQETTLRMDSLQPGGMVRIYRPIADR